MKLNWSFRTFILIYGFFGLGSFMPAAVNQRPMWPPPKPTPTQVDENQAPVEPESIWAAIQNDDERSALTLIDQITLQNLPRIQTWQDHSGRTLLSYAIAFWRNESPVINRLRELRALTTRELLQNPTHQLEIPSQGWPDLLNALQRRTMAVML